MPHGLQTAMSLSKTNPICTPKAAEVLFSCRAASPATPLSTVEDIISLYGFNDQASYADRARKIVNEGFARAYSYVQPPGLALLEAAMYAVSPGFPLGLGLIALACCLWASLFTVMASALKRSGAPYLLALAAPTSLFFLNALGEELGFGIWLSDCYASILCLLSMALLTASVSSRRPRFCAVGSGIALAGAAYMRAQMDIIALIITALVLASLIARFAARRFVPRSALLPRTAILMIVAYHALTLPYRIWNGGQWVTAGGFDHVWSMIWNYPSELPPEWAFFSDGGGTVGCAVDEIRCHYLHDLRLTNPAAATTAVYKHLTLTSLASHPIAWLRYKLHFVVAGWNWGGQGYALALVALFLAAVIGRYRGPALMSLAAFLFATTAGVFGPLILLHLEVRYLEPLKLMLVCAGIYAASSLLARLRPGSHVLEPGRARCADLREGEHDVRQA